MNRDTSGPAFPVFPETSQGHAASFKGMNLRDYFAAKAMQSKGFSIRPFDTTRECAKDAYAMADAMLEARK